MTKSKINFFVLNSNFDWSKGLKTQKNKDCVGPASGRGQAILSFSFLCIKNLKIIFTVKKMILSRFRYRDAFFSALFNY
jgi:hypothetical protein